MDGIILRMLLEDEWSDSSDSDYTSSSSNSSSDEEEASDKLDSEVNEDSDFVQNESVFTVQLPNGAITKIKPDVNKDPWCHYSTVHFKSYFGISKKVAQMLLIKLVSSQYLPDQDMKFGGRKRIEPDAVVLVLFRYLLFAENLKTISVRSDLSVSTVHRVLKKAINFILSLKNEFVKWPSKSELNVISKGFLERQGIEGVVGALGSMHVQICAPRQRKYVRRSYLNNNKTYSIQLQCVCDHRMLFTDVFCGECGSLDSYSLLKKSPLYKKAFSNIVSDQHFILADSSYQSLKWLVPPVKSDQLSNEHIHFNQFHEITRQIIDDAFNLVKKRFKRIENFENADTDFIAKSVEAMCILHNICILYDDLME